MTKTTFTKELTASQKLQEFLEKEGIVFTAQPTWIQRDDGHWDTILQVSVDYKK